MAQELDEVEGPEELIEGDLDELVEDDDLIAEDGLVIGDDDDAELAADEVEDEVEAVPEATAKTAKTAEESEDDEEEEPDDEDVEASLDVILKERLVVEDEPEDEEATDQEDKTEGNERVLPKQPDEFVCRSCFLVKHPSQLADEKKMLCRDCV